MTPPTQENVAPVTVFQGTASIGEERQAMADFKDTAAGIQSIITSIAIIVGGGWALFTFWDLGTRYKAQLDIAESEQRLIEQPVLNIDIRWDVFLNSNGPNKQVGIRVIFRNDGKRGVSIEKIRLQFKAVGGTKATTIEPVSLEDDGEVKEILMRLLRPGQSRSLAFITKPLAPGPYLVQARTIYTGFKIEGGALVASDDEPIDALEQIAAVVPP
jgi:hypothetical protein